MGRKSKTKSSGDISIVDPFDEVQYLNFESLADIDESDIEDQKLKSKRYRQDTDERKLLSHWVIGVVSIWLFLTVLMLGLNRLLCLKLSDVVCCMLLGTTTVNILGLAYIVLKGLFPDSEK
jgi:hypothetical protein